MKVIIASLVSFLSLTSICVGESESISPVELTCRVIEKDLILVSLNNTSDRKIYWSSRDLPPEQELVNDIFEIVDDEGKGLEYGGVYISTIDEPHQYLRQLKPSETFEASYRLRDFYALKSGEYRVSVEFLLVYYFEKHPAPDAEPMIKMLRSKPIQLKIKN